MNIAVFLDEVMPINGALMLIQSHRQVCSRLATTWRQRLIRYGRSTRETVTQLASDSGIVAPTGKPGSVLMFHGNQCTHHRRTLRLIRARSSISPSAPSPTTSPNSRGGVDRAPRFHADRAGNR
jgi:hypothetical protein